MSTTLERLASRRERITYLEGLCAGLKVSSKDAIAISADLEFYQQEIERLNDLIARDESGFGKL